MQLFGFQQFFHIIFFYSALDFKKKEFHSLLAQIHSSVNQAINIDFKIKMWMNKVGEICFKTVTYFARMFYNQTVRKSTKLRSFVHKFN